MLPIKLRIEPFIFDHTKPIPMKNNHLNSIFSILLVSMVIILSACGKSTEELVIGTWTGTDFDFEQTQGPSLGAMIEGGMDLHVRGKLILEETGTYIISSPDNVMNGKGVWEVKSDQLIMTDDMDNEVTYEILEISEEEMITLNEVAMETPLGNLAGKITLTYKKQE